MQALIAGETFPKQAVARLGGGTLELGAPQLVDLSNAPFARPDLAALAGGLDWIRAKDYPIRDTWRG